MEKRSGKVVLKRIRYIEICVAAVVLSLISNLSELFGRVEYETTVRSVFISSTFDCVKVLETQSFMLGIENLCMLIVFLFLIHDFISFDISHQGVYALVRIKKRTSWYWRKIVKLLGVCGVYVGIYLMCTYLISMHYVIGSFGDFDIVLFGKVFISMVMLIFFCSVVTVIVDMQVGRNISILAGTCVLCLLVMLQLRTYNTIVSGYGWALGINPASGIFLIEQNLKYYIYFIGFNVLENGVLLRWFANRLETYDIVTYKGKEGY